MNVLVPISPTTRETIIRGVTAVGRLLGSGNWWTERAYAGALSSVDYTWYTVPGQGTMDGTSACQLSGHSHANEPILASVRQSWPAVAGSLSALYRNVQTAYAWASDGVVGTAPLSNAFLDWCTGYAASVPAQQATGGLTWIVVSTSGVEVAGRYEGTTVFEVGTVLYEGSDFADALAHR